MTAPRSARTIDANPATYTPSLSSTGPGDVVTSFDGSGTPGAVGVVVRRNATTQGVTQLVTDQQLSLLSDVVASQQPTHNARFSGTAPANGLVLVALAINTGTHVISAVFASTGKLVGAGTFAGALASQVLVLADGAGNWAVDATGTAAEVVDATCVLLSNQSKGNVKTASIAFP